MTVTRDWYLEVNGIPLATYAWEVTNLDPLLDSAPLRGEDTVFPTASGWRANPRRRNGAILTFPLAVFGDKDEDGSPITEPMVGAVEHLAYLEEALGFPPSTTVPAIFHRGSLTAWTADAMFLGFTGTRAVPKWDLLTTFDLAIPAGRWEEVGS